MPMWQADWKVLERLEMALSDTEFPCLMKKGEGVFSEKQN